MPGNKISISDIPDAVLREAMEADGNHDGFLDVSEITKAFQALKSQPISAFEGEKITAKNNKSEGDRVS